METVKLSRIVMELTPELSQFLKPAELDSEIVLLHGFAALDSEGAMEIVQYSISEHQKKAYIQ